MGRPKGSRNRPKEEASIGHNSHVTQFDTDALKSFVSRAEELDAEKALIAEDRKELFIEAKNRGFDVAVLNQVIKIRKQKTKLVNEARQNAIDAYLLALGDFASTPLGQAGQAAIEREAVTGL